MGRFTVCSIVVVFIGLTGILPSQASSFGSHQPITLQYHLHGSLTPGAETDLIVASATGNNSTLSTAFGDVIVFNSPLRKTAENNSTLVGNSGGTIVDISHIEPFTFFISFTAKYNTTVFQGTFSAQGRVTPLAAPWELAVIGGTGDFRGARGYATVFNLPFTGISDIVLSYTIHMFFD